MKYFFKLLTAWLTVATLVTACQKNVYDADTAKKIMEYSFHNDTVDQAHTWTLISDWTIQATANVQDVKRIEVLSANPYTTVNAEVLAQASATQGEEVLLYYTAPLTQDSVYVAAVNNSDHYTVVAASTTQSRTDFSQLNTTNSGTLKNMAEQEVYYCYCNSFPEPSQTWGFNDMVLRLSKKLINERKLRITVTIEAIGSDRQMAGALRLADVSYNQIESVETLNGASFVKNHDIPRYIIKKEDLLLRGQDGTAVINMFDDAHEAFFSRVNATGTIYRYFYNVKHTNQEPYYERTAPTVSYDITFKQEGLARSITFDVLDPFMLVNYNNNIFEIHKYKYKFKETLFSYFGGQPQLYNNGYTWALEIPYSWFRYPRAGESMGSYKNGALYGAYQTRSHSFGEWGADKSKAQDWYLYPTTSMVY